MHYQIPYISNELPLGISFFTLHQISYLIDTRIKKTAIPTFIEYATYVVFFPQLIAGPIVRFYEFKSSIQRMKYEKPEFYRCFSEGFPIFIIGLFYKVILADYLMGPWAKAVYSAASAGVKITFFDAWIGSLAYTFQLYFDFAGYSYMALGIGRLFQIELPLNFNSPYSSTSIIDFWKRWHMTLSRFLRDYIYISLGGSKYGLKKMIRNIFCTMIIGGLWHGAGWTFVLWGGYHGILIAMNHLLRRILPNISLPPESKKIFVFILVMLGWIIFRSDSIEVARNIYLGLFGFHGIVLPESLQHVMQIFHVDFLFSDSNIIIMDKRLALFSILIAYLYCSRRTNLYDLISRINKAVLGVNTAPLQSVKPNIIGT
jgi:D-alanyl-lipoteichoic acid acyltransferase DltB (MBOAT superfamily)